MPGNGPVGVVSASPQSTAQGGGFIASVPAGPGQGWTPWQIVQGFIDASASYPTDAAIARQYLTGPVGKTWDPKWSVVVFNQIAVPPRAALSPVGRHGGQQAVVKVTGAPQTTLNGTGQYVSAQLQRQGNYYNFNLIKVNDQWRISNPPPYRMLTQTEFSDFYNAQDLYFLDLSKMILVPDSVFVPQGTSSQTLVKNLVTALIQGPEKTWLASATVSTFPEGTTILDVAVYGATAVVNLGGAMAHADPQTREQVSAQLVWTLAGSSAIQSVELEVDGTPVKPSATRCGGGQGQSPVQKLTAYECYDPSRSAAASFYYVNDQQAWSRCGSERQVQVNSIGAVVPVFGRKGAPGGPRCAHGFVGLDSITQPPVPTLAWPASMAAVSPDGLYVAYVSPAKDAVYTGQLSNGAASFSRSSARLTGTDITAISWDREDELWVAQNGTIWMLPPSGVKQPSVENQFGGDVTGLSVAPDGVRVAAIVQTDTGSTLDVAAIDRAGPPTPPVKPGPASAQYPIGQSVQLGPNIKNPVALTWYDADDLIVLNGAPTGNTLWEVPVDGQSATELPVTPPGTVAITADGAANVLVAGLSGHKLAVSTSLEGPWLNLSDKGQNPAYPG
jgi:hypothetical protein